MPGRGGADQEVVLDADTSAVPVGQERETPGPRAGHYVHPVDGSTYLDIGEGLRLDSSKGTRFSRQRWSWPSTR